MWGLEGKMKKLINGIGLTVIIIILAFYTLEKMPKHTDINWYSSVIEVQSNIKEQFYDFYHPHSYFDHTASKKTLTEINQIRFYTLLTGDDYTYGCHFDENSDQFGVVNVGYVVSKNKNGYIYPQMRDYHLIDEELNIYYTFLGDNDIEFVYCYDMEHAIKVTVDYEIKQNNDREFLMNIALNIMEDSILLNKKSGSID